jgi:hypothetical protein
VGNYDVSCVTSEERELDGGVVHSALQMTLNGCIPIRPVGYSDNRDNIPGRRSEGSERKIDRFIAHYSARNCVR